MPAAGEFVEGWLVTQLLGEGAYGEVRLLVHARSGACVALKVARGAGPEAAREAALQRALRHPHVLRCLGARLHRADHYTFLEYAAGGDLFERIAPDTGMPERSARRYFRQLLTALVYLSERGVAHRDIKPENLLLDHRDDLKVSDFGMATLFRHGARERLLTRVCGTVPYAAPEVLRASERAYRAPPADLWAGAVALVAMLAGELPWERASPEDARYVAWARAQDSEPAPAPDAGPWRRIHGAARALLRRALRPAPERRATPAQLLQHRWLDPGESAPDAAPTEECARAWRSQPAPAPPSPPGAPVPPGAPPPDLTAADMDALISYSQPTRAEDLLLAGTQEGTQLTQASSWTRLGARLTRVRVSGAREEALARAAGALRRAGLPARRDTHSVRVEWGPEEAMVAWAVPEPGGGCTLLQFRRARGCGLRFQRRFRDVRAALAPLAPPAPPAPMDET